MRAEAILGDFKRERETETGSEDSPVLPEQFVVSMLMELCPP